jgi:gluconolactonase
MKIFSIKYLLIFIFCLLSFSINAQQTAFDTDSIIERNAVPMLVSKKFGFTEGPAVDKYGNIFFTDQPNNKIWKYSTTGKLTIFLNHAGRSNGLYIDNKGNIIACADEKDQLWLITKNKKIKVLIKNYKNHLLNGPNDLWIDTKGGIYFTDPYYQRSYWKRTHADIKGEKVYYLPKNKKEPVVIDSDLIKPNGIVGSADGKILYVSDIGDGKTYQYKILKDGNLADKKLFINKGADGITLDEKGDLYLCGNGITVYDSTGKKIAYIPIKEKWTANLCFGGKNKKLLFITASEAIYTLQMRVKGIE